MLNVPNVFTQGAMKALVQAQISAASMGHEKMGSGHLLCGLCRVGDELTRCILGDLTAGEIEEEVLRRCGRGEVGFSRVTGLTPHAQRALLRAVTYANPEKKILAGIAHIWQELLYEDGCTALIVLDSLGRTVDAMRTVLFNTVGEIERPLQATRIAASSEPISRQEAAFAQQGAKAPAQNGDGKTEEDPLEAYARNLTQAAARHELEPLIGREAELDAMIQILGKKMKNNPLLLGEPGVGKSALAEGLAMRVASRDVPPSLLGAQIYALDLALLVAGTKFRGEFEERIKGVVSSAQERGNVILFIDELHTLIGAGSSSEGSLDAANILKPALARGTLRVIGATTYKEYRKYIEKDAALARRFQRIDVHEPNKAQTLEILSGLRERYENFHHVEISDEALISAVELSSRYVTDRFMPDKAIDLIDEAASMANVTLWKQSVAEETLENEAVSLPGAIIREDEIARVIAQWTGVPVERIGSDDQQDILTLEERLSRRVVGQDEAISAIAKALRRARAGLSDPTRPLGVFMLLGPSGVGKTELCKALSEALFGSEDALIRVDMSEYSEEATASRLIGSPPGYVGYGDGGQLTDAVLKRPYSVVLFDEIEKAHSDIQNILLQILEDGTLTDAQGRKADFSNTIILLTSNLGARCLAGQASPLGFGAAAEETARRGKKALQEAKDYFRPELMGRLDDVVLFDPLGPAQLAAIADRLLCELEERAARQGYTLRHTPAAAAALAGDTVPAYGARELRRKVSRAVEQALADRIAAGTARPGVLFVADAAPDGHITLTMGDVAACAS